MESTEINGVPSIASDAVLIKSEKMPAGTPIVKGIHVEANGVGHSFSIIFPTEQKVLIYPTFSNLTFTFRFIEHSSNSTTRPSQNFALCH